MTVTSPSLYMQRALDLAGLAIESVSPNPMVGCVIVHNGEIIGEGYHAQYGGPHAEVNAVNSVLDKSLLNESEVYVTLEPCSHYGKTPPCADLLIKHQVKKVIVCNLDPNPLVAGKGLQKLRDAGIDVEIGLHEQAGLELNKRFFKAMQAGLPYVIVKWAETADGFVANVDYSPLAITNSTSNLIVHKWRSEEDAILVGKHTVETDNPSLNVRNWPEGKNPVRVVLDRNNSLAVDFKVFDQTQKTLVYNLVKDSEKENLQYIKINEDTEFLLAVLKDLKAKGIHSVFVEGGPTLIKAFFDAKLVDEVRVLKNDKALKDGIAAPHVPAGFVLKENHQIINDNLRIYRK